MKNNKMKSIIKRLTIYSSMVTLLFVLSSDKCNKRSKGYFRINTKISNGKIEYENGTIYIGKLQYLSSINGLNNNDVLVFDNRNDNDPNVTIFNSYKIMDPLIREEIIEGLLMYEECFPTKWNRSKNSLAREWTIHNIMYWLGCNHNRTMDVDLNNSDEKKYRIIK